MFQVQSTISGIKTLVDGSIRLTVDSQELNPEEMSQLFQINKKLGWFTFQEAPFEEIPDVPEVKTEFNDKTPSQRLRNTIYVLWSQLGGKGSFDDFYKSQLESLINQYKEKLN